MKVSVITMHYVKNYGSALQTYATQKYLEKLGCKVEFIDYWRNGYLDNQLLKDRLNSSKIYSKNFFTRIIGILLLYPSIRIKIKCFSKFLSKYINLSQKRYISYEELLENPPKADIYCTGSDQVWNSKWNNGIEKAYFLDFVPKGAKCISYSASFGKDKLDESEKAITKKMLAKYSYISLRERSALDILRDLGINNGVHVLDPTLMLNKKDWEELIDGPVIKEKYVLVYQLNSGDKRLDEYAKNFAKSKGLKLVRFTSAVHQCFKYGKTFLGRNVEDFISCLMYAEYIITDSFHATAFSINMNKKFITVYPKEFSTRLESILQLTNLEYRHVEDFTDYSIGDTPINYNLVNSILDGERALTDRYLKIALGTKIENVKVEVDSCE